jgi:signal recognition particle receptor subunit beta
MALFNHAAKELTAKIVYYGPGLCGKTTNLKSLHQTLGHGTGKLLSLSTAQDRTIFFDLLPVELGNIKGYSVRFQVCTVPGQVFYNETRKIVLRGVDGLVFVVDSQWSMLSHNLESFQNLKENLRGEKISLETLPVVIQYNKRDLPSALSVEALQDALSFHSYPFVEAVASEGSGVIETFKLASKLTFVDLLRRLQRGWQAPAEAPAAIPEKAPVHAAAMAAAESESHEEAREAEAEALLFPSVGRVFPGLSADSSGPIPAAIEVPDESPPQDVPEPPSLAPTALLAALTAAPTAPTLPAASPMAPVPFEPPPFEPPPIESPPVPPPPQMPVPVMPAHASSASVDEKLDAVLAEARKAAGRMSGVLRRLETPEASTQEIPANVLAERRLAEAITALRVEMHGEIGRLREEVEAIRTTASSAETAAAAAAERARRLEDALRQALHDLAG